MITISHMTEDHIPQIVELEQICFSDPWSANAFAYELKNSLSIWLVALDGDTVAGYVGSQTVLDESDMMNIAVRPEYRRKGIGNLLVKELSEILRKNDVKTLSLEVRKSNYAAISLYDSLDFVQVGIRPNYYRHPKEDAIIMRKELC